MSDNQDTVFDHKSFLQTLTHRPGVYRMLGDRDKVLYVGKAKDLKNRVSSYFRRSNNLRIQTMVSRIRAIDVTVTHTETEALLLENNLIKALKPKYNILLRDDKGYPYIYLSDDEFPQLTFHRGARKKPGRYFGPYPSAGAVRETLRLLQKIFPVRQCENSYYQNRSRPCLQYQIKLCSAPCVGFVSKEVYRQQVKNTVLFLEGKTHDVVQSLVHQMEAAANALHFEEAAQFRDQIDALRKVQEKQYVSGERGNLDIVACVLEQGTACIQIFFIRQGRNLGNKTLFPKITADATEAEVIAAFVGQYYLGKPVPGEIITNYSPLDQKLLEQALATQSDHKVHIRTSVRGVRSKWLQMAEHNAQLALRARLASSASTRRRLESLARALHMEELPQRMECFDISHTGGEKTVASCVVFNQEGPVKSDYRRFNIKNITPGDDYAAMHQALTRRYRRLQEKEAALPDILFIDGGKGQLSEAQAVLNELGISGVLLVGVAKGPDRRPGMEQLFLLGQGQPLILSADSSALHLVQQIRDEAHRFAISGHRQQRAKSRKRSVLEDIPGIGPKRRQRLIKQFGGLQGLSRAGVEDIATVEGVSRKLAQQVYEAFHGNN